MPRSAVDPAPAPAPPGQGLAVFAETLYLANLLLLPGIAFLALLWLYLRHRRAAHPLAANHLGQTITVSLWAGALLVAANGVILILGGYRGPYTWVVLILYFTVCHSTLVLLGIVGLSKAMAGQFWRFPLLGPPLTGPRPGTGNG